MILPLQAKSAPIATVISEEITDDLYDEDNNYKIYARIDYSVEVEGAQGHTLRFEYVWRDNVGDLIYSDVDEGRAAISSETYDITSNDQLIEDYVAPYYKKFVLKPSSNTYRLNAKLRIYDETLGEYIEVRDGRKLQLELYSQMPSKGIVITELYQEHNEYRDGAKGMYVRFTYDANWLKGVDIKWTIQLFKKNGTPIYHVNGSKEIVTVYSCPNYTFSEYNDPAWGFFPYSGFKLPKGKTDCYAIVKFYDATTGKPLPVSGNNRIDFYFTR